MALKILMGEVTTITPLTKEVLILIKGYPASLQNTAYFKQEWKFQWNIVYFYKTKWVTCNFTYFAGLHIPLFRI
jgi:hypothetical protein